VKESIKILILEDSAEDAEILQLFLVKKNLNCEFHLAIDKKTYLLALDQFHPDIILSDHSLPQFNSVEALAIARQKFPGIPFIMVTGTVSEEFAADIIKSGADDYILKDRLVRLPVAITTVLERRNSEKEKQEAEQKIKQSETNLRAIFENTSEGFLLMDRNAVVMAFNNKATAYTFFSDVKEFKIGQSIYDFIEEPRKKIFREIITRVLNRESIQYDRSYEMENGNTAWIDFSLTPVIESGQVKGICITGRNITEKKKIEQEREFDRNNLKALINNTNDLMWSVDRDFRLITSNDAFDKIVKTTTGRIVSKESGILARGFSIEQRNWSRKYYERTFSGENFTVIEHDDFPWDSWSEISFYPIYNGDTIIGAACFSRDITERKKAEENFKLLEKKILEQKVQEQKKIARAIINAQEKERNHIGQELHDNINQILVGIKLHLSIAGKDEKFKKVIKYSIELLNKIIQEIRILSSKLVTPLKNINLQDSIQMLLDDAGKNTTIKTSFEYNLSNLVISDDLKLNIYRIIQEQLNNIVKYADAKNLGVSLQADNNVINIVVQDDGKGFDVNKKRKGIGISNIINRVGSYNGEVVIESSPGMGCKVEIRIPY